MLGCSGKFVLRIPPDLHERLKMHAKSQGVTLNAFCTRLLQDGSSSAQPDFTLRLLPAVIHLIDKFGASLLGIILFGSTARGETYETSDIDLLIALDSSVPIQRCLYHFWDQACDDGQSPQINPHFCHVPAKSDQAGSLWLEAAKDGRILFDRDHKIDGFLSSVRDLVRSGQIITKEIHGHPYWVWRTHA